MDQADARPGSRLMRPGAVEPVPDPAPEPAPHWVDLSLPIGEDLPRWKVRFDTLYGGFANQTSTITLPIHCATHLDAPLHYIPGGLSVDKFPLEMMLSEAYVVDLTDVRPNQRISVADIAARFPPARPETVLLRTDWPRRAWRTPGFWSESPVIGEDVAVWLAEKQIRLIGYDFPQEEPIKELLGPHPPRAADFKVHLALLARGVWQIEYLTNLHALGSDRVTLLVCPLPLAGLEGSPVRVLGRRIEL